MVTEKGVIMYGTIFNLKVREGHQKQLLEEIKLENNHPKGMLAWFLMTPDDKTLDWIGVAVFESKKAHINNSNRPEQNESFNKMMQHLEEEPKWTDGEYSIGEVI